MEGPRSRLGSKDAVSDMRKAQVLVEARYGEKRNASKSVESASPEKAEEQESVEIQADADISELPKRAPSKSSEQYVK